LQLAIAQVLPVQVAVACAAVQTLSQKPQWTTEIVRSVSQLTLKSPSHSPRPGAQGEATQAPAMQI
jgi:hypothetical protein